MPATAVLLGIPGFLGVTFVVAVVAELVHPGSGFGLGRLWLLMAAIIWWPIWWGLLIRRYGVERVEAYEKNSKKQEARYQRWFFAYFMPIIALVFLIIGLVDAGPGWRAAHGQGVPGMFTVTSQDCHRGCMTYGDFTSADGSHTQRDVQLIEGGSSPRRAIGTTVAALDTGDRLGVYPVGTKDWEASLIAALGGAVYRVGWLFWLGRRQLRWLFADRHAINLP